MTSDLWDDNLLHVHSSSVSAKHGQIQCKMLHRALKNVYWYRPVCYRRGPGPASLIHMLWSCPSLYNYWSNIFDSLLGILRLPFHPAASTALFGLISDTVVLPRINLVAFLAISARRLKPSSLPSHEAQIRGVLLYSELQKIKYTYGSPSLIINTNCTKVPTVRGSSIGLEGWKISGQFHGKLSLRILEILKVGKWWEWMEMNGN